MGLDLYTNDGKEMSMPYNGFARLRCGIANAVSEDLGQAYMDLVFCITFKNEEIRKKEMEKFLNRAKSYDPALIEFLLHSDCSGTLKAKTCKALYSVLNGLEVEVPYPRFVEFLELIKHAAENRRKIYFS